MIKENLYWYKCYPQFCLLKYQIVYVHYHVGGCTLCRTNHNNNNNNNMNREENVYWYKCYPQFCVLKCQIVYIIAWVCARGGWIYT